MTGRKNPRPRRGVRRATPARSWPANTPIVPRVCADRPRTPYAYQRQYLDGPPCMHRSPATTLQSTDESRPGAGVHAEPIRPGRIAFHPAPILETPWPGRSPAGGPVLTTNQAERSTGGLGTPWANQEGAAGSPSNYQTAHSWPGSPTPTFDVSQLARLDFPPPPRRPGTNFTADRLSTVDERSGDPGDHAPGRRPSSWSVRRGHRVWPNGTRPTRFIDTPQGAAVAAFEPPFEQPGRLRQTPPNHGTRRSTLSVQIRRSRISVNGAVRTRSSPGGGPSGSIRRWVTG
jgi:hypothetical protein